MINPRSIVTWWFEGTASVETAIALAAGQVCLAAAYLWYMLIVQDFPLWYEAILTVVALAFAASGVYGAYLRVEMDIIKTYMDAYGVDYDE